MRPQSITRRELNQAVETFIQRGGLVVQLVPEKTRMSNRVGQRWGQYEEVLAATGAFVDGSSAPQSSRA